MIVSVLRTGRTRGVRRLTTVKENILRRERAAMTDDDAGLEASLSQSIQNIRPATGRVDLAPTQNRRLKKVKAKDDLCQPIPRDLIDPIRKMLQEEMIL